MKTGKEIRKEEAISEPPLNPLTQLTTTSFSNFSKVPVMAFEAAIKNIFFFPSFFFLLSSSVCQSFL